jgi:hypothetical protein
MPVIIFDSDVNDNFIICSALKEMLASWDNLRVVGEEQAETIKKQDTELTELRDDKKDIESKYEVTFCSVALPILSNLIAPIDTTVVLK